MAVTNVKNNFFERMFGKPSQNKKNQAAGIIEGLRFQSNPVINPGPVPNAIKGAEPNTIEQNAAISGGIPDNLNFQQPNELLNETVQQNSTQATTQQSQDGRSRYKLFQMLEGEPTRDIDSEEKIKQRQKLNAISKGISGLAGLAGMATGGDAPVVPDFVTPFNMQQIQMLDSDYRNRLQDWIQRSFQIDNLNTQQQNREIDQQIDYENQMDQIAARGEEARLTAEQRALADLNKIAAQGEQKLIEEMQKVGVNPYGENAYGEFLKKMASMYETEKDYTKARTNWNNRISRGSSGGSKQTFTPEQLATYKKNRDRMIAAEQQKLQALDPNDPANQGQIKAISDRIEYLQRVNPGSNELIDMEMLQDVAAEQAPRQPESFGYPFDPQLGFDPTYVRNPNQAPASQQQTQGAIQADPQQQQAQDEDTMQLREAAKQSFINKINKLPEERRGALMNEMGSKVLQNIDQLNAGDVDVAESIVNEWVNAQLLDNEEEAYQILLILIEQANQGGQQE